MPAPVSIIQLCRPKEWVKNLFVLLPLFFSGNLFNFPLLAESFITLISFCLASSAIYCLNDLMDVESDRRHPAKPCMRAEPTDGCWKTERNLPER